MVRMCAEKRNWKEEVGKTHSPSSSLWQDGSQASVTDLENVKGRTGNVFPFFL
jgi:hypothetical protein